MKKLATFISSLALLSFVTPASAQCYRSGCQVGPCVSENILVDSSFFQGCQEWVFSGAAQRMSSWAELANGFGVVTQNQPADVGGSSFSFTYYVQFENALPTYWQELDVYLYDADTGQQLALIDRITGYSGNFSWQKRDFLLGSHPDWKYRNLQVRIEGYAYYGAVFKVTDVHLWQSYW